MIETIFLQIWFISITVFVLLLYFPVAYLRRRMKKMSEEDLLKIDREEWVKQVKSNAYTKLICRGLLGLVFLCGILFQYQMIVRNGIDYSVVLIFAVGISFILFAVGGYKTELRRLDKIKSI